MIDTLWEWLIVAGAVLAVVVGLGVAFLRPGRGAPERQLRTPPKPEPEPEAWTPPRKPSPPLAPPRPIVDPVEAKILPTELLSVQRQIFDAEDISEVLRMLDLDEQDAADIADVLAILD